MTNRTVPSSETQITQVESLAIRIAANSETMSQDVASLFLKYLQSLLAKQRTISIIMATGNSQLKFLEAIASNATNSIDWSRIILFHLDEYLGIAAKHPGSFRYYLHHKVEQKLKPYRFHYIQGDAAQPLAECAFYSDLLNSHSIDLCMLGIGDNGHLAFNEPSVADFEDPESVKLVRLELETRQQQVNGGYFPDLESVPSHAYTLTIPAIAAAKKIFCLAGGSHKADVVEQTLTGEITTDFPATILRTLPQATLFCTQDTIGDRDSFS